MMSFTCNSKYNFKAKKPRLGGDTEDQDLEESVRRISALFNHQGEPDGIPPSSLDLSSSPPHNAPLQSSRVAASLGADIAAALVQAQARIYEEEEEEEEEEGDDESGPEVIETRIQLLEGDVGDDEFPIPLRTRKGKEPVGVVGVKRKR